MAAAPGARESPISAIDHSDKPAGQRSDDEHCGNADQEAHGRTVAVLVSLRLAGRGVARLAGRK